MKDKILLFIPAYNCEKQINRVLSQLNEEVIQYISEVIVINNRSTDGTEAVVEKFMKEHSTINVKLLRNIQNYGLGGSHKVAFNYAEENNFDYVIVLHGDDQGNIQDILPILKSRIYQKYDCCLGARFMKGSRLQGYSKFRTFGNVIYDMLFSFVVKRKIYDLGSGLNMYSIEMLKGKFYNKFPDNLTFNYCMILAIHYYRQNVTFFPISWREDDQVSNVKMVNQALNVLGMLGKYWLKNQEFIQSELRVSPKEEYLAEVISESRKENAQRYQKI